MLLRTAGKYLRLTWELKKKSLLSAMEYRASFLLQVTGMVVNDIGLMLLWGIFFKQFPTVNGWGIGDTAWIFALSTTSFGIVMIAGRGVLHLAKTIVSGDLDYYLSLPVSALWHTIVSRTDISAIGDALFGIAVFFFVWDGSALQILLFLFFSGIAGITLIAMTVITQSLTFWLGDFEDAAENVFHTTLVPTLYPQNIFSGALKIIMMTIIPTFFLVALPAATIKHFAWNGIFAVMGFAAISIVIAIFVWRAGLRRYESGSLINVRA